MLWKDQASRAVHRWILHNMWGGGHINLHNLFQKRAEGTLLDSLYEVLTTNIESTQEKKSTDQYLTWILMQNTQQNISKSNPTTYTKITIQVGFIPERQSWFNIWNSTHIHINMLMKKNHMILPTDASKFVKLTVPTGLEKVSFHSNPNEGQCQRMYKLPHNYTHFTC